MAVRPGVRADLPTLTEIYNHYVVHDHVTFDLEPFTVEERADWFDHYGDHGRHRLLVAERDGVVVGYATSSAFRAKPAYRTTVETTIYLAPGAGGAGIGSTLYRALLDALADEDVHRAVAGIALPNPASVALHRRVGFRELGTYTEVGFKFGRYVDVQWFERAIGP